MNHIKRTSYIGYNAHVTIYPAPALGNHTAKGPKRLPITEQQKAANRKRSLWYLQGLIMANFVPHKDMFVTLTHKKGTTEEQARKAADNLLNNLRAHFRRRGEKFKYILVTEKQGQWHHHFVISNTPKEVLEKYWGKYSKRMTISPLDDSQGYFDLVQYLLAEEKQSRTGSGENALRPRKKNEKAWTCSQGLSQPPEQVRVLKNAPKGKLRPPKGYEVVEGSRQEQDNRFGRVITYQCRWIGSGAPTVYQRAQRKLQKQHARRKASAGEKSPQRGSPAISKKKSQERKE